MKRIRKFQKPVIRFSNRPKWIVYLTSYILQIMAFIKVLCTGKEVNYAFYYSKKQDAIASGMGWEIRDTYPSFNGKEYSECSGLENGWNNWNDSRLIGIGNDSDIKFKSY